MAVVILVAGTRQMAEAREASRDESVIAVVLGKQVTRQQIEPDAKVVEKQRAKLDRERFDAWLIRERGDRLMGIIFGSLLKTYVVENDIQPTDAEIEAYISGFRKQTMRIQEEHQERREKLVRELRSRNLKKAKREQIEQELKEVESTIESYRERDERATQDSSEAKRIEQMVARERLHGWKVNKSLWDKYGGRVIFQQAGPEPLDAYVKFLREHEQRGSFSILKKEWEEPFWRYFRMKHTFFTADEAAKAMQSPPEIAAEDFKP